MLAEERFGMILQQLVGQGTVTVQHLCETLGASESTIRRDLAVLHSQGRLVKVHGGATLPEQQFLADEPSMTAKEEQAVRQKQSVGAAAAAMIGAGDFVYIDAGSTTLQLVRALGGPALRAGYVTNGIAHARALAQKGCRVWLPAGQIRPNTEAIAGADTLLSLKKYNFTKAFLGANGVALREGFTTPDVEEANVKAMASARARESWFLVDDTKFGKVYAAVIRELPGASLLTNRCPDERYKQNTTVKETEL